MQFAILLVGLIGCAGCQLVKAPAGSFTGTIRRLADVDLDAFLGIPFAEPPVGNLRFALPVPIDRIESFDATKNSAACPQPPNPMINMSGHEMSEDCLKLSIYRRKNTSSVDKKPVVIVIHGGGYVSGTSAGPIQSGMGLAAIEDIIIVALNYRLGVLGFADMGDIAPGNLGLHDQRLAIKWVRENIAAFGGNPERITLMGVSAGSMSVAAQVITPLNTEQYFRNVILDAGTVNSYGYIEDPENSLLRIKKVAEKLSCSTQENEMLDCLRRQSSDDLIRFSQVADMPKGLLHFVATKDDHFIPRDLDSFLEQDNFSKVRMLIGYARNEGSLFANTDPLKKSEFPTIKSTEEFIDWCTHFIKTYTYPINLKDPARKQKLIDIYYDNFINQGTFNGTAELQGDGIFKCPVNAYIRAFAKHHQNVYVYQFDRRLQETFGTWFDPNVLGAFHFSPFLHFTGVPFAAGIQLKDMDKKFILDAMRMISLFVRSDEAPSFRGVRWPDFSKTGEILVIDEVPFNQQGLSKVDVCDALFSKSSASSGWHRSEL